MPIVLKPSRKLVEYLGDQIATEIVSWFNTMDTSQKSELREINEQNFARFDAKFEQRTAELEAKIDRVASELGSKIDRVGSGLDSKIDRVAAELREGIERRLGERMRWLYLLLWGIQTAMIAGLYFK